MRKKIIDGKDAAQICRNCAYGSFLEDDELVFCKKTGMRKPDSTCKKFKYDPLCRVPRRAPKLIEYSEDDFTL